jgi:hypothetical protein
MVAVVQPGQPGWFGSAGGVVLASGEWPQNAAAAHRVASGRMGTQLVRMFADGLPIFPSVGAMLRPGDALD